MARTDTKSDPTTEDFKIQIEALKGDIANLANLVTQMGGTQAERVKETAQDTLDAAREAGAAHVAEAKAQAHKLGAEANDFVVRQPAAALGIAAGIGFLIGMLGARR